MEGLGMADAYACAAAAARVGLRARGQTEVGADECRSALSAGWMRRSGVTVALLALAYSLTHSVTHSLTLRIWQSQPGGASKDGGGVPQEPRGGRGSGGRAAASVAGRR
eukprot:GHVU01191793.1.p2 GENE.GHVU01191793.1~~GHVU01191793.1.p2  ORF type:complete len:109 (+),score=11.17 GHVU01191793.1:144-470(+)